MRAQVQLRVLLLEPLLRLALGLAGLAIGALRNAVRLSGADGNAFNILGLCQRAARDAGWSDDEITAFVDTATSGDYDNLLTTAMFNFDVI